MTSLTTTGSEVAAGIHCVSCPYGSGKPLHVYLLAGRATWWIDVGINTTPASHVVPYLETHAPLLWRRSQVVLITHADMDHYGGLAELQARRPETLVFAPAADRHWIESPDAIMRERFLLHEADGMTVASERQALLRERGGGGGRVDVALTGGEEIFTEDATAWTILPTPGHTDGHVVLWDAKRRFAIIGDAVVDWGVFDVNGNFLAPPPYFDVAAYRQTIAALRYLGPERLFTSHYGILDRGGAEQLFANSLAAVDVIGATLEEALRTHRAGATLAQLCDAVGAAAARWPQSIWPGLADPISAHLAAESASGRVERFERAGRRLYRLRS